MTESAADLSGQSHFFQPHLQYAHKEQRLLHEQWLHHTFEKFCDLIGEGETEWGMHTQKDVGGAAENSWLKW